MHDPWRQEEDLNKPLHFWNIVQKGVKIPSCPERARLILEKQESERECKPTITWTVGDIAKAARLLTVPPIPTQFEDEQEMRRVYTLIYDTFRYKQVFTDALNDATFFQLYPQLEDKHPLVWLLFFDMYHRSFRKREPGVVETARKLFIECGILSIEEAIWHQRVKLAAAISRLRIKNSALRLSELLPHHLRDERVSNEIQQLPVTCWINPNKVKSEEEILNAIQRSLCCKLLEKDEQLQPNSFKWDTLCPNFIVFHSSLRTALAKSSLVHKHKLIVQDRSFCLGPATFGKIMIDLQLAGNVVQSHINSPRTTAYLATLLSQNTNITDLLVFNAGARKAEYEKYLQDLGTKNVAVYSERMMDFSLESTCFDRVIAVFATPPNSYTAVYDPVDLICSRGGDLGMLEVLTDTEASTAGQKRVISILEEQRKTLAFAMSRPQIQFVLYETHSELNVENDDMVKNIINNVNKLATMKQAELQGKMYHFQNLKEINNNAVSENIIACCKKSTEFVTEKVSEDSLEDVVVPDCDLFCKAQLPSLCSNGHCTQYQSHGCFLALLQRKEVMKLDSKYMIRIAEERGLFGVNSSFSGQTRGSRASKTSKQEKRLASPATSKIKRKKQIVIDRISAPTQASIRQSQQPDNKDQHVITCPRCHRGEEPASKDMDILEMAAHSLTAVSEQWQKYKEAQDLTAVNVHPDTKLQTKLEKNPLYLLQSLTYAGPKLKDLISSRVPPSFGLKSNYPNYGWRFYFDKSGVNTNMSSLCEQHRNEIDGIEYSSGFPRRIRDCTTTVKRIIKRDKKKRELKPAEILLRVSQPTHSSLTRSLPRVNEKDDTLSIPECEKCKKRNVD